MALPHASLLNVSPPDASPVPGRRAPSPRWRPLARQFAMVCSVALATPALAVERPTSPAPEPVRNSAMDGTLFFTLLLAEVEANAGQPGPAYQRYLEAARRLQEGQLFQRAVEIALRARAGEQALTAAKAWRQALPQSREAAEFTTHILIALGRSGELAAPMRAWIQLTPAAQQNALFASLPRSLARLTDRQAAANVMEEATQPWRQPPLEIASAWAATAETWLQARQPDKAQQAALRALALQPDLLNAQLVLSELVVTHPEAEAWVKQRLQLPEASPLLRLAYARKLAGLQRFEEAATQLDLLVAAQPQEAGHRVLLAAVRLEMRQVDAAEQALRPLTGPLAATEKAATDNESPEDKDLEQALLLMAQVADRRNQPAQALAWLDRADPRQSKLAVQAQRARLLATQGKLSEARKALRRLPETEARDAVLKVQAEAQLLRELKQWQDAWKVLSDGVERFPEDPDLLYDQAMVADKLNRPEDMEQLLRRLIAIAPDNAMAFNALGYSLADRSSNLIEARKLLEQANALRPGDPFIIDSLGWLAYREGNLEEALKWLQMAHDARPDTEIAAHLGEVLWQMGRREDALRVWRAAMAREAHNPILKETLQRLGARP